MSSHTTDLSADYARRLGGMIRSRRHALGLRLEDLASASGVGIRFVHDLERGKPSCQLGRSLLVAAAVGLRPLDLLELEMLQLETGGEWDLPAPDET